MEQDKKVALLTLAVVVLVPLLFWVLPSYFEARTYSKLTGKQVSTWDALWVELRVQGE